MLQYAALVQMTLLLAQYDLEGICSCMNPWASFIKLDTNGFICEMVCRSIYARNSVSENPSNFGKSVLILLVLLNGCKFTYREVN